MGLRPQAALSSELAPDAVRAVGPTVPPSGYVLQRSECLAQIAGQTEPGWPSHGSSISDLRSV